MTSYNENLLNLIVCPNSKETLELVKDENTIAEYKEGLKKGKLCLKSTSLPSGEITGFLKNVSGQYIYPVINKISLLTTQSNIVDAKLGSEQQHLHLNSINNAKEKSFQAQMNAYSKMDERCYKDLHRAIQEVRISNYYSRFIGKNILDVGNGGISLENQMGKEMASKVGSFISVDKSFSMLSNSKEKQDCVLGDGLTLPFADNSFDYVIFNGVIHHLGRKRGETQEENIKKLCSECLRVSRKGIIFSDFCIPKLAEWVESLIVKVFGQMATYAYSKSSLLKIFKILGYQINEMRFKPITTLISPLKMLPPILFLEWLWVPAFIIPYTFVFGVISKSNPDDDLNETLEK
jgi:ubiquinone/menaquinone biosynthesis C-methylase UbiE/uncharacterized protein YbaR (Trm112 family)